MATVETIPLELRQRPRWVLWKLEGRDGKKTKIPYQVKSPQREASSTDSRSWATYDEAVAALEHADGVGFVLGDGIVGIDLDDCVDEHGKLDEDAEYIVQECATYTEWSPSKNGLHLLMFGELKVAKHRVTGPWGGHFEVYEKDRFFTITGEPFKNTPHGLSTDRQANLETVCTQVFQYHSDSALLRSARKSNPDLYDRLFEDGDSSGYNSQSEADLALANVLAKKCKDEDVLDRLMRRSALMRDKWDGRDGDTTWLRKRVVQKALSDASKSTGGLTGDFDTDVNEAVYRIEVREAARQKHASKNVPEDLGLPEAGWSLQQELELPRLEEVYRIDQMHPTGGNVLLVAAYKSGKTTLTLNLLRALADGLPFLGKYEVDPFPGNIAVFNYEETPNQWLRHIEKAQIKNAHRIFPVHRRGQPILPIWEPRAQKRLVEWMIANEITYWIMDPTVVAWQGLVDNENDNALVAAYTTALDQVKSGAGIGELLLTHHEGRLAEGRGRGATRLEDWMDAGWYLSRDEATAQRSLWAKGRDVEIERFDLEWNEERWMLTAGESVQDHKEQERVERDKELKAHVHEIVQTEGEIMQSELLSRVRSLGIKGDTKKITSKFQQYAHTPVTPGIGLRTEGQKKVYYWREKK